MAKKPVDNKEKHPRGWNNGGHRPEKEINLKEFEELAMFQCTVSEIASHFGMTCEGLSQRMDRDSRLYDLYKKGLEFGKKSLRRAMFQKAMEGNVIMQIFLSKQYLGFSDKVEEKTQISGDPINIVFSVENVDKSKEHE